MNANKPEWQSTRDKRPDERELVTIRIGNAERRQYYRIEDRWYSLGDLERWAMNTSPYWPLDRTWYLRSEDIRAWRYEENPA